MRTALLSALVFGACTSLAFAEPWTPVLGALETPNAEAHGTNPVVLTEAEMDKIAAGGVDTAAAQFYTTYRHHDGGSATRLHSVNARFAVAED